MSVPIKIVHCMGEFLVLKVDSTDGTVLLSNPEFKAKNLRHTIWAVCETPLTVGQVVEGGFDIDPLDSLYHFRFPVFTPF